MGYTSIWTNNTLIVCLATNRQQAVFSSRKHSHRSDHRQQPAVKAVLEQAVALSLEIAGTRLKANATGHSSIKNRTGEAPPLLSGMYIISFHVFLRSASVVSSPMMIGLAPVSSAHMAMSFPGQRSGRNAAVRDGSAYPPRRCGRFSPWAAARRRLCLPASH